MRMLARVEGMPLESLRDGVPWAGPPTAEYLDAHRRRPSASTPGSWSATPPCAASSWAQDATRRAATARRGGGDGPPPARRASTPAASASRRRGPAPTTTRDGHMVPSRYATADELLELCRVAGAHPGTSLEFIPMVGAHLRAVGPRADGRHVGGGPAPAQLERPHRERRQRRPGRGQAGGRRPAPSRGGKVVALTIPMSFGVRLSLGVRIPARRHARAGRRPCSCPAPTSSRCSRTRPPGDALNAGAQAPDNPMRGLADWSTMVIFDVVADENAAYVGRTVGEIAADQGRDPWDALRRHRPGRRPPHQLRDRPPPPRPTTTGRRASSCGATRGP